MYLPPPGTIGLAKIGGLLGRSIRAGQVISGDISPWTHAFIVVDSERVIEAQPGGARYASLAHYMEPGQAKFLVGWPALTKAQQARVPELAERYVGTPYSFLDYLSLAAYSRGLKLPLTRRRIRSSGHLICSQLADVMMADLGVQLFDDDREPMDVTPGDIDYQHGVMLSAAAVEHGFFYIPRVDVEDTPTEITPQDLDDPPHKA